MLYNEKEYNIFPLVSRHYSVGLRRKHFFHLHFLCHHFKKFFFSSIYSTVQKSVRQWVTKKKHFYFRNFFFSQTSNPLFNCNFFLKNACGYEEAKDGRIDGKEKKIYNTQFFPFFYIREMKNKKIFNFFEKANPVYFLFRL